MRSFRVGGLDNVLVSSSFRVNKGLHRTHVRDWYNDVRNLQFQAEKMVDIAWFGFGENEK